MNLPPFLQKLLPKLAPDAGAGRPDPARDWALLVALFLALFLAAVAWSAWFFLATIEEPAVAAPPAEGSGDTGIGAVRAAAEARSLEEERYRAEYRFIDPSI